MTSSIQLEIIAAVSLAAMACSIPGTFLILRKDPYGADIANRSSTLGFALGSLLALSLSSPPLIVLEALAAGMGILLYSKLRLWGTIDKNSAAVVASALALSLGLLVMDAGEDKTGTDISAAALGELAFIPFDRVILGGIDIGSWALYSLGAVFLFNVFCVAIFYKELKISTLDENYARSIQTETSYAEISLLVMTVISVAAAFQTAGAFMAVAFILGPAASAHFYAKRLSAALAAALLISLVSCLAGYGVAHASNISISGTIALTMGIFFIISVFAAPETGLLRKISLRAAYKKRLEEKLLLKALLERDEEKNDPSFVQTMARELHRNKNSVNSALSKLRAQGLAEGPPEKIKLTEKGVRAAEKAFKEK